MADTTFVDKITNVVAAWLNDVNIAVYRASSAIANSINRTQLAKNSDWTNTRDFGGDNLGNSDSTAFFNLATQAAATYSSALYGQVNVVGGIFLLGAGNSSVFVRKGQKLNGAGLGATSINASGTSGNTVPLFTLGSQSNGTVDGGGQAVEVCEIQVLGGPSTAGVVDTTLCSGWSIHDVMFTSPGIGIVAGGGDGLIHDCFFDQGLNGIVVSGQNILINDCNFYTINYQLSVGNGANDVTIAGCQFEYPIYASILFQTGATLIHNTMIRDCNFIQNIQYGTFLGAIVIASGNTDFIVSSCNFRNLNGPGIAYSTGLGSTAIIEDCLFDGNKTVPAYAQSTTMQGVSVSNMVTTIRGSTFRNLPGQPITFGGTQASTLIVDGCDFRGNTGGTVEILITNSQAGSVVIIKGCTGSGRPLVNNQTTVPVIYTTDNVDGAGTETTFVTSASHTVLLPEQSVIVNFAGTVTLTLPQASLCPNRKISIRTITANAVVAASANIIPLIGGAAGTAILAATAGKWASLRSDGTNWEIESAN